MKKSAVERDGIKKDDTRTRFSIIVVCLNPGDKLAKTLQSILAQDYADFEVIVKDGGSRDGSIEAIKATEAAEAIKAIDLTGAAEADRQVPEFAGDKRIRLFIERDTGIYDAMNQAVAHTEGEFIIFMNCGDVFPAPDVLAKINGRIQEVRRETPGMLEKLILYGNTYSEKNNVIISSPPEITGFTCYRNIPCHQSCVYAARLCKAKPYDLQYRIRADYDHFLWCYYVAGARFLAMDVTVASYEGGGFSENKENRKRDGEEHRQITAAYMGRGELLRYRLLMFCTLAPLRRFLAENPLFSGAYHWVKERVYHAGK